MALISGTIPSLINGVSQQPATLRLDTQGEVQENGLSHIARGLEKRPCTEHVKTIAGVTSNNSNDVFIHTIRRSEDEAYALIVKGTDVGSTEPSVKLIDLTGYATGTAGNEVYVKKEDQGTTNVTASDVLSSSVNTDVRNYLGNFVSTNPFEPSKLSATTIADFTFLLNKSVVVQQSTADADDRDYEALIYFKIGDFGADYKVEIKEYNVDSNGEMNPDSIRSTKTAAFKTPDNKTKSRSGSGTTGNTESINNQAAVIVSNIAWNLYDGMTTVKTHPVEIKQAVAKGSSIATQVVPVGEAYIHEVGVSEGSGVTQTQVVYTGTTGVIDNGTFTGDKLSNLGGTYTTTYNAGESIMHISNSQYPFTVEVTDGKGDAYMRAVNGSDEVAQFGYLPGSGLPSPQADGFVAKISGDKSTGQDDYYVKWEGNVWKETIRPVYPGGSTTYAHEIVKKNARINFNAATMPVNLYKAFGTVDGTANSIYFILSTVDWESRTVGDLNTNPFPSFANYELGGDSSTAPVDSDDATYTINDIFFHRNRLGFVSDENVILSQAGDYFNFWHSTVLSVLDTAVIDVAVSNNQVAILKSAIPFQENLVLFSDLQQFKLTSDSFLTPTSVVVDVATNFETSTDTKPVPAGKTIFFPFQRGAYSGIREYFIDVASETNDANEVTAHVPEYIEGTVKKMAVSSNEEVLLILSDTDRRELIVYKYYYNDKEKLQSAWSKWKFDAEIIDVEFIGSVAFILFRRGDGTNDPVYLEKLNLSVDSATTVLDDKIGVRLDRRVKLSTGGVTTLPYSDADYDKLTTSTVQVSGSNQFGSNLKIKNLNTTGNFSPRIGQTFSASGVSGTKYKVIGTEDVNETDSISTFTAATSDLITTSKDHGLVVNDEVVLTTSLSDLPAGLAVDTIYYVKTVPNPDELTLSGTSNLTATINITDTGTGVHTLNLQTCTIKITPSIAESTKWSDGKVLTFDEREVEYIVETGEKITSSQLAGVLANGTQLSNSRGNSTPVVYAGVPYDFRYQFSQQFVKSNDNSINSGRLQLRNFEISYDKTGAFTVEVSPRPFDALYRDVNIREFTGVIVGTSLLGQKQLETGVFRVPVYCNSKDVRITVNSTSWYPLALQSADWEALQVLRNQRV